MTHAKHHLPRKTTMSYTTTVKTNDYQMTATFAGSRVIVVDSNEAAVEMSQQEWQVRVEMAQAAGATVEHS